MSVKSLGASIRDGQLLSHKHPMYTRLSDELAAELARVAEREAGKRATAAQAVVTQALGPYEQMELEAMYPEFRVHFPLWDNGTHAYFRAHRQLVNQVMHVMASKYVSSYVHYGSGALQYLTQREDRVTFVVDGTSQVALGESADDDAAMALYARCRVEAGRKFGWVIPHDKLERYQAMQAIIKERGADSKAQGDALIVDGSLTSIHPKQFFAMMETHGAQLGYYSMPYDSTMHVQATGQLGFTDVQYQRTSAGYQLLYPDGIAGTTFYSQQVFNAWLVNGMCVLPGVSDRVFHMETVGVRGPFMIVKVVRVEASAEVSNVTHHSLQLDSAVDKTIVRIHELVDFKADPKLPSSWALREVYIDTRVVTKTYEYAMACEAANFTLAGVTSRLSIVNDRVVVKGVSVETKPMLDVESIRVASIAIFSHAFVARYEMGQLTRKMFDVVNGAVDFRKLSTVGKLVCLFRLCAETAFDATLGVVDEALRTTFDRIRDSAAKLPAARLATFDNAPKFVKFESIVEATNLGRLEYLRKLVAEKVSAMDVRHGVGGAAHTAVYATSIGEDRHQATFDDDLVLQRNGVDHFCDVVVSQEHLDPSDATKRFVSAVTAANALGQRGPNDGAYLKYSVTAPIYDDGVVERNYTHDVTYRDTMDTFHEALVPGMELPEFKYDTSSLLTDDQHRALDVEYLSLSTDNRIPLGSQKVYLSKLKGYNITRRTGDIGNLLSGLIARNCAVPVLAAPVHMPDLIDRVVDNFMKTACVADADVMFQKFQATPVLLDAEGLAAWGNKATSQKIARAIKALEGDPVAIEQMRVDRNDTMIKADVKVPMSDKPIAQRVEPQTIVHLPTEVNAVFSALFRTIVDRLLSVIKPQYLLGVRKSPSDIRAHIAAYHVFGADNYFAENDFSKFDKAHQEFMMTLLRRLLQMFGLEKNLLEQWMAGQEHCSVSSMIHGLTLWIANQNKSGSPLTSAVNIIANFFTTMYVYRNSTIEWGVWTGDDSLMEMSVVALGDDFEQVFAQLFNLESKLYLSHHPYFASNYVLIDEDNRAVTLVPDPLKRVEKWSVAIGADDPKWEERYQSALETCGIYMSRHKVAGLEAAVRARHTVAPGFDVGAIVDALATAVSSFKCFREIWDDKYTIIKF